MGGFHPDYFVKLDFTTSEFGRQNFLKALIKNPLLTIRVFFYSEAILKVSCKNIEKWLSYNKFVGIDYANVANRDMGDLVHFFAII